MEPDQWWEEYLRGKGTAERPVERLCALAEEAAHHPDWVAGSTAEELSKVYAYLLDFIADGLENANGNGGEKGHATRKSRGSYFTPPGLVQVLVEHAVRPLVRRRVLAAAFDTLPEDPTRIPPIHEWTPRSRAAAEDAILNLRIWDPACGTGVFLAAAGEFLAQRLALVRAPLGTASQADLALARRDAFTRCLAGRDIDPGALAFAQLTLRIALSGPIGTPIENDAACNLFLGDSLLMDADSTSEGKENAARVDCILGNPPFINAIEGGVSEADKAELSRRYPEVGGTADLAYYFLALAHRETAPDGTIGLVLPRALLTAKAANELRRRLLDERPPSMVFSPRSANFFPGANVYIVAVAFGGEPGCIASHDSDEPRFESVTLRGDNWWSAIVSDWTEATRPARRLADDFEIFASMTTGMAYDLLPFVHDEGPKDAPRLLTTGLIDPGRILWGRRICRYLKHRFERPLIVATEDLPRTVRDRLQKVRRPKVLVAGLAERIEAVLDELGRYCGAVSTYTFVDPDDNIERLRRLCDYLNSPEVTTRFRNELGAQAMGGGRITVTRDFLRHLPAPLWD